MEFHNIEWSSTRRESSNIIRYSNYIQDWPQKIMESETGLIFQASTPKSKMKPYLILKSTEAIVIQNILPRRATLLFRRDSHWMRYDPCVWKRCWTWFRRWLESVVKGRGMVPHFISRYVWSISRSETWNSRDIKKWEMKFSRITIINYGNHRYEYSEWYYGEIFRPSVDLLIPKLYFYLLHSPTQTFNYFLSSRNFTKFQ